MYDTGAVSTFEKYVLGTRTLSDKQLQSCREIQTFLRSVGIERTLEEIVLTLKLKTPDQMGEILAEIKAKWQIAIPKPRIFSISPAQDEALQAKLVGQGPDMAKNVVECRKIGDGLSKFGVDMTVSEILIAKGYYTPASMRSGVVLEAAPTTEEVNIKKLQEQETAEEKPVGKTGSGVRRAVGSGSGIRPGVGSKSAPAPYKAPTAEVEKKKQQKVFLVSLGAVAVAVIAAIAIVISNKKPEPQERPDPVTKNEPIQEKPAPVAAKESVAKAPPVEPKKPEPEPVKPDKIVIDPDKKAFKPEPDPVKPAPTAKPIAPEPATAPEPPPEEKTASDAPQDPDPTPPVDTKANKKADREKRAKNLWDGANALIKESKFVDALDSLRDLRDRYLDTEAYLDNRDAVETLITDCGYKIAATGFRDLKPYDKTKPHIDTILGFQFNPPAGWRGIPNWQAIFGERDTGEQEYRGQSYRCARYTSRWLETVNLVVYKTYAPASISDVIDGAEKYFRTSPFQGLKDTASGEFTGIHKGIRKLQVDDNGNRIALYCFMEGKKGYGLACYWRTSDDEDFFPSKGKKVRPPADDEWAAAVKVFDQVAKTFQVMDQPTLAGSRQAAKNWGFADDGWCVKCSDWNALTSKSGQYIIEYATRKDFAERLGRELDTIMSHYKRIIYTGKGIPKCRVKLFDTEEDFQYYGQAYGAAAYWSPMQEEIVAYRFQGTKVKLWESKEDMTIAEEKNPEEVTFGIIYHEAFHQYMYYLMGRDRGVYVPSWLNEGMGDYFFGGKWFKGKFEIGTNDWRLETIVKAVKDNKHVKIEDIIRYTQGDYYSRAGLCYAQGWSMNYFFLSPEGKKRGYDQIPMRMFTELKASGDWKKATDRVFAGVDLKKMESDWKEFVLSLEKFLPKKPEKPAEPAAK